MDKQIIFNLIDNKITELNLYNKCINDDIFKQLYPALKLNKSLKILNLENNYITELDYIINILKKNSNLTSLNLGNNEFNNIDNFLDYLKYNTTLQELLLCGMGVEDYKLIPEMLKVNTTLTVLNIGNRQDYHFYEYNININNFQNALTINKSLTSLNLTKMCLGSEYLNILSEFLKYNKTLENLILSENLLKDDINIFYNNLQQNKSLKYLSLYNNLLHNLNILNNCLKYNSILEVLDLSYNNINSLNDLTDINYCKELNLSGNELTINTNIFFDKLKLNSSLVNLNLFNIKLNTNNDINDFFINHLLEYLKYNTILKSLNLSRISVKKKVIIFIILLMKY